MPPPLKGLKKALSTRRRSEPQNDAAIDALRHDSVGSIGLDKSPSRLSIASEASLDGSSKSGSSGVRKLIPGHAKRTRRRVREEELRVAAEEVARGRSTEPVVPPASARLNRSTSSLAPGDGDSNLLTDDEGLDEYVLFLFAL